MVHMGTQGAGYYSGGQLIVEPASVAERVINSTGTGDVLSMCMILLHSRKDLSFQHKLSLSNKVVCEYIEGQRTMIPSI